MIDTVSNKETKTLLRFRKKQSAYYILNYEEVVEQIR